MTELPPKFKEVYEECYQLYPDAASSTQAKLRYLHRQWIFANHIDVVLELVSEFREHFYPEANTDICLFAALLHDTGLVYKRFSALPEGHENRSREYAEIVLQKHGFNEDFIQKVCTAIAATETVIQPATDEAIIVRNADAYSHLSTVHFLAKAYFADELPWYVDWFDKKAHGCIAKLTIPELIEEKQPLIIEYEKLLATYRKHKDNRFID
jgi:HD superfamily phosphodiesterase